MSYTKNGKPASAQQPAIRSAIDAALQQFSVDDPVAAELEAAGIVVTLETGVKVWVSAIPYDRPETPQIDFICAAVAIKGGKPWVKPNGQMVASVFWHGMWPDAISEIGVPMIRKALMLVALGEPQPQVPIATPAPGGPTTRDAIPMVDPSARSIRPVMDSTDQVSAVMADVL